MVRSIFKNLQQEKVKEKAANSFFIGLYSDSQYWRLSGRLGEDTALGGQGQLRLVKWLYNQCWYLGSILFLLKPHLPWFIWAPGDLPEIIKVGPPNRSNSCRPVSIEIKASLVSREEAPAPHCPHISLSLSLFSVWGCLPLSSVGFSHPWIKYLCLSTLYPNGIMHDRTIVGFRDSWWPQSHYGAFPSVSLVSSYCWSLHETVLTLTE